MKDFITLVYVVLLLVLLGKGLKYLICKGINLFKKVKDHDKL